MTPAQLATYVRNKTGTTTATLPDSLLLIYLNLAKNEICGRIKKTSEDYFGFSHARNLEAGIRNYAFDPSILNSIDVVEAKIDGVNQKKLVKYDLLKLGIATDEDNIKAFMAGRSWGYFIYGSQLYVLSAESIINVTDGIILWGNVFPKDITDLSSTDDMSEAPDQFNHGIPLSLHGLLATRCIIEYKSSKSKPIPLTERESLFYSDLQAAIDLLTGFDSMESIVPQQSYTGDGSEF